MLSSPKKTFFGLALVLVFLCFSIYHVKSNYPQKFLGLPSWNRTTGVPSNCRSQDGEMALHGQNLSIPISDRPRLIQATVIYPGPPDPLYEGCLNSHIRHGEKWGYRTEVLHELMFPTSQHRGLFNKIAFLLSLLLKEMALPAEERAEWLL